MTKQQHQADITIHEDQLLNFLVNALTGAFGISIAELSVRREVPANKPPDDRFTR